jgi:2-polyprenyl-3-methyl-5-hydroxy-6-metoxy-1,4-benzoquinol methylase
MYGTETSDPVVKYYDQTFAVTASNDIAWYADHAQSNGGRVLDLACGTGRISIALARAGLEVTAIDDSEGMLQLFRNKLNEEPEPIQSRIGIQQARMESFELPDRFSSIVCCDAFFHNSTVDEQISCLFCVAKHLIPRGSFAFNIPQPTVSFLSHASSLKGRNSKREASMRSKTQSVQCWSSKLKMLTSWSRLSPQAFVSLGSMPNANLWRPRSHLGPLASHSGTKQSIYSTVAVSMLNR